MAKSKKNQALLMTGVVAVVAIAVLLFSSGQLSLGSFTFEEQSQKTVSQNGQTVTLNHAAFLNNEPISINFTPSMGIMGGHSGSLTCPPIYSVYCQQRGWCGKLFFFNNEISIYANGEKVTKYDLVAGYANPLNETASQPFNLTFDLPANIKSIGGFVELKFYRDSHVANCFNNGAECPNHPPVSGPFATEDYTLLTGSSCGHGLALNKVYVSNSENSPLKHDLLIVTSIYVEPPQCTDSSYITYEQVFKSGETIKMNPGSGEIGFRIANPVFCHSAPVLKQYTDSNQVFEQSNAEYDALNNGGYITVPAGQQWVMFYRGSPTINDALVCQDNSGVWNATDNRCELPPTLYFVCNGIVTLDNSCVVQATDYRCENPQAQLQLQENGSQICVLYLTENDYDCIDPNAVLEPASQGQYQCVVYPEESQQCSTGYILQVGYDGQYRCVTTPEVSISCPVGAELRTAQNGAQSCVYEPVAMCSGELRIVNGQQQCIVTPPVVEGPISGNNTILLIIGAIGIGALLWISRKK